MITRKAVALALGAVALLVAGCSSARVAATVDGAEIAESTVLGIRTANEGKVSVAGDQYRSDLSRLIVTEALLVAASWIDDAVERADIIVRSDIGTWSPPVDAIVPPPESP